MQRITADKLEQWARTSDAPSEFPRMVRLLIHATCTGIRRIEFPSGRAVTTAGLDGVLECAGTSMPFLPSGVSLWELSTQGAVTAKANEMYRKRTEQTAVEIRQKRSFVFATPCAWNRRLSWEDSKNEAGEWGAVKAIGSTELETWLIHAPWIAAWYYTVMGTAGFEKIGSGLDLTEVFRGADPRYGPSLPIQLVTAGREKQVNKLQEWLLWPPADDPHKMQLVGRCREELEHFVGATIASSGDSEALGARTLVVRDRNAAKCLPPLCSDNVVVADQESLALARQRAAEVGCRLLELKVIGGEGAWPCGPQPNQLRLEDRTGSLLANAAKSLGFSDEICESIACERFIKYGRLRDIVNL